MAVRYIQIFIPEHERSVVGEFVEDLDLIGTWRDDEVGDRLVLNILLQAEDTERVMDKFEEEFSGHEGFRIVLMPVEAVLPRLEERGSHEESGDHTHTKSIGRVSREELYNDISDTLSINRVFSAMIALSAIVAAVGLIRDDVAVIIGAMVIAPLLGPNVATSLSTALGDTDLLKQALVTSIYGIVLTLGVSILIGLAVPFDPSADAIASRTNLELGDLILALAAGSAGTFAYTRGLSGAVIGVMVAVALVPPLVAAGLLLGAGHVNLAVGAGLLASANVVCINLSGVATFLAQGVRPRTWWEDERAKMATRIAVAVWSMLLTILGVIIYVTGAAENIN